MTQGSNSCLLCLLHWQVDSFTSSTTWEAPLKFKFSFQSVLFRRRHWRPTPVLLPGKSHGWRSLVGCSPWGREELDTTERLHFHFSLSCIGEGNGNPLQCSFLENLRDRGAWWAAVYGVAQSRTRLKRRSSSSSSCKCSKPGFPVHHQLPKLAQTHVHRGGDAIQPSHPLVPFSSCLQSFPGSRSFLMSQLFVSGGQSNIHVPEVLKQ